MRLRVTTRAAVVAGALTVLLVSALLPGTLPLDNGVGLTPAMGWSTWNTFQGKVSDALLRQSADAMVSSGLAAAGYQYVNLDDGWCVGRAPDGTLIPDPTLFPNGMKPVADYIHSKGLKFGMYTARGSTTCMGRPGANGHEAQDAATYAAWGVDYLKGGYAALRRRAGGPHATGVCACVGAGVLPFM